MLTLDSHAHCGSTLPLETTLLPLWEQGNIDGGVLFSPVEEVYDRYNRNFTDNEFYRNSRTEVHNYLKSLMSERIFAYWFVWNDFLLPEQGFSGIKWHRHSNEPEYLYESEECARFIDYICNAHLPIIIEEEFHRTWELVERINRQTVVIIPHFGGLNGGYARLKEAGLFDNNMIYVDTALASSQEIIDFAANYGADRILFGSDFPFGDPAYERHKLERIFSGKTLEKVLAQNLLYLLGRD
jgi:hypothetical protein